MGSGPVAKGRHGSGAQRVALLGLALLGLAVRLPGLPYPGTGDMDLWKTWAYGATTRGVTRAYPLAGRGTWPALTLNALAQIRSGRIRAAPLTYGRHSGPTDYPPATIFVLWLVGGAYRTLFAPDFADGPAFNALIKAALVLADAATALFIGLVVRRRAGADRWRLGGWVAVACWCNPATILGGAYGGYLDALYGVLLAGVLAWAAAGQYARGWAGGGLAFMVKLQALFVLPALALLSLRQGPRRLPGYVAAGLAPVVVCSLPFLWQGTFVGVLAGVASNLQGLGPGTGEDYLSANQANLWWLWSYFYEWHAEGRGAGVRVRIVPISLIEDLHIADLNLWALGLFLAFVLGTGALWWRGSRGARRAPRPADLFLLPLHFYGATMLLTTIHENHLLGVLPLLALLVGLAAVARDHTLVRRLAVLYAALTVVAGLNITLFYGLGRGLPLPLPRFWFGLDATVALAALNVVLFATTVAVWGVDMWHRGRSAAPGMALPD